MWSLRADRRCGPHFVRKVTEVPIYQRSVTGWALAANTIGVPEQVCGLDFWSGTMLRQLISSSRWVLVAAVALATLGAESPPVGAEAPDFTLRSLGGGNVTLSSVVEEGPVALVVLRGFPGYQCPVCSRQVHDFINSAEAFADAGARVLFVYPGPSDDLQSRAQEFVEDKTFPEHFSMLLDPDFTLTNLYGVRWKEGTQTAYPSTFLIDGTGKIIFEQVSEGVGGRTVGAEMAAKLK